MTNLDVTIETSRLTLRRWTLDDAASVEDIYGDPETMRLFGTGRAFSPEELHESFVNVIAEYAEPEIGNYAIIETAAKRIIGHCGIHRVSDLEIPFEADWLIRRDSWGHGYATEAATAVIRRFFEHREAKTIGALARLENLASIAVMRKLGMRFVRNQRLYGFESVVYVLTAGEFLGTNRSAPNRFNG